MGDQVQGRAAASGLGDQVEELAAPRRCRSIRAPRSARQRRIVGLQHGELGDVGPVDHPADGTLAQIGGERRYLGQFGHIIDSA